MIICTCRNISDETPDWKEKIMRDDFKCGQCQFRLMNDGVENTTALDEVAEGTDLVSQFLKAKTK